MASAALYAYYVNPLDSSFCSAQSGCDTLRRTPLAYYFDSPYNCQTQICAVRAGSWKLHFRKAKADETPSFEPSELYHLDQDPAESVNRLKDEPKLAAQLAAQTKAFHLTIKPGPRCPPRDPPRSGSG